MQLLIASSSVIDDDVFVWDSACVRTRELGASVSRICYVSSCREETDWERAE